MSLTAEHIKTKLKAYHETLTQLSKGNRHFMGLIINAEHPLSNSDLESLIKKNPERWARFTPWVGNLKD